MKAFSNDKIKDKLCGGCDCTGFTPDISFIFAAPDSLTIEDDSVYPAGDSRKIVHITLTDRNAKELKSSIASDDVDDTITMNPSTLDLSEGFSIRATVVTANGCISDGMIRKVGVNTAEGVLGAWDKDYDAITIPDSES